MTLPIDSVILILASTTILALLVYLREYNLRQKAQIEGDKFLQDLKKKGWETLHQSITKSQNIIGEAELEGVKVEALYRKKLDEIITQTEASVKGAYAQLIQFMNNLQKEALKSQQVNQNLAQERVNQLFGRLEEHLSNFLMETAQKTSTNIELELKSTRALIDTYKQEQLKLIDENILAMMEQTLSTVLNKKLSLEDQLDLVYEALEKAKVEKFIV